MANAEQVGLLKQGVEKWNQWRINNPEVQPDLGRADLSRVLLRRANLRHADLNQADLRAANLRDVDLRLANLQDADLRAVNLITADLSGADLRDAQLFGADLRDTNLFKANLSSADLHNVNLRDANLSGADLSKTNLCGACLIRAQVLGTVFAEAIFTGACIEDWHLNSATKFDDAICDYVYLKTGQQERRPRESTFKTGEFAALFQQAVDTVDLIFKDGINWQAFFQSFQDLRNQYVDQDLAIQDIERKQGGSFVVRLEVAEGSDKSAIESRAKERYEANLALMEQRYRAELHAKEGEIIAYKEQSANLMEIVKLQASRPITIETTAVAESNVPKYNLSNAQFAGGFAETVQGDQIGGTINNQSAEKTSLAEAAAEIQTLLKQLEQTAPAETMTEKMTLATQAIAQIEANPTFKQRTVAALTAGGIKAFESAIDHPVAAFVVGAVEEWQKS